MLRIIPLLFLFLPLAACQLAIPIAATQVALPLATSQTVLQGNKQMVEIRSDPAGAKVSIAGYPARTTPTFIMLARGHSHTVRLSKDGYKDVTTTLTSQRGNADASNSNLLAAALDSASGAAFELYPDRLTVQLESAVPTVGTTVAAVTGAPPVTSSPSPVKVAAVPAVATPPIVQQPTPTAKPQPASATVLAEQIARIDRLLEQGVITEREHDLLTAAALSAAALAGAGTQP
ncbi:MAG: PEGA domain-containing protein [Phycisphaerales bacterium]|nr:PEGA domain-containing protein [Phycisphaerales bacterium]